MKLKQALFALFLSLSLLAPTLSHAHEVYVLNGNEIEFDLQAPRPDFLASIDDHFSQFAFWGVIVAAILALSLIASVSKPVEKAFGPLLSKLKPFAPHIAQVTLGLALVASGWNGAIYGVELPLGVIFGSAAPIMTWMLMVTGAMLVFGILPRIAAMVSVGIFVALTVHYGFYMLNYGTYLGEAAVIALFGGAHTMLASRKANAFFTKAIPKWAHSYSFLAMRVLFGSSLIYASLYAKLFHGALAVDVVTRYDLTRFFPFDPVFLVLGAMIIELLLGACFILGVEIRFGSLFFLVFLCLSVGFFGEAVWPHIILIGTALSLFAHGYDRSTMLMKMEKDKSMEPVF